MFSGYGISAAIGMLGFVPLVVGGSLMALISSRAPSSSLKYIGVVGISIVETIALSIVHSVPPREFATWLVNPAANGPNMISILFFWLPIVSQAIYSLVAKRPRPVIGGVVSAGAIAIGVLFFIVGGTISGATID